MNRRLNLNVPGLTLSRMAWGLGSLPPSTTMDQVAALLHACLGAGITTLDNAENYGGGDREGLLGDALALSPGLRDRFELVTKCGCVGPGPENPEFFAHGYDTRKEHILAAAERSLRRMKTEALDGFLLHRFDPLMDVDEVGEAFVRLKDQGKVRFLGVSNFLPHQVDLLASRLPFPLSVNEIQCSVMAPEPLFDGTLDQCQRLRMVPLAWGPLGRGALFEGTSERSVRVRTALLQVGQELGVQALDQLALAWLLRLPSRVAPLLGTDKPGEIRSNAKALDLAMTPAQWQHILCSVMGWESLP
jgi:predicted oxidoreductase